MFACSYKFYVMKFSFLSQMKHTVVDNGQNLNSGISYLYEFNI